MINLATAAPMDCWYKRYHLGRNGNLLNVQLPRKFSKKYATSRQTCNQISNTLQGQGHVKDWPLVASGHGPRPDQLWLGRGAWEEMYPSLMPSLVLLWGAGCLTVPMVLQVKYPQLMDLQYPCPGAYNVDLWPKSSHCLKSALLKTNERVLHLSLPPGMEQII